MNNTRDTSERLRKMSFALMGAIAIGGALALILLALFPYFYAESGSARYAREHQGEAALQLLGAAVLLFVAWQFIKRSFTARTWLIIVAILMAIGIHRYILGYVRVPAGVQPAGGNFHLVTLRNPDYIDTVHYDVYYKHGVHYQRVADLAVDPRFVAPDCLVWRGLIAVGRPVDAMCGYRKPVESYDTTLTEQELLRRARSSASY